MEYRYVFDFGPKPTFVIDAWLRKALLPIALLTLLLFGISIAYTLLWGRQSVFVSYVAPALAGGALLVFAGVIWQRRRVAIRQVGKMQDTVFRYCIDDEGYHYENELAKGVIRWEFKGKLMKTSACYVINNRVVGALPVPLDAPQEVLDFVAEKLRQ